MPSGRQRSESKRKLFRAITTRISHHNHASSLDKDDCKDERDEREVAHSPYNDSTNINVNTAAGSVNNGGSTHLHGADSPQTCGHEEFFNHNNNNNSRQPNLSVTVPVPITQGSDQTHYSYAESVKKAPTKKRSLPIRSEIITPTSNLKIKNNNNKIRSVLPNTSHANNGTTPDSSKLEACSPATETSANTDMSFMSKTDSLIINSENKGDMNEYDYKTFSTRHPLRFSKVKAFEQAELTTRMYFSKFQAEEVQVGSNGRSGNASIGHPAHDGDASVNGDINNDIIIQIPEMSKEETGAMLGHDTVETKITDGGSNKLKQQFNGSFAQNSVEQRIFLMKNALKPLSKEEIVSNKLQQSKLPDIFQNTGEFLKEMDPQEIEFWELMNEEFENDLRDLYMEYQSEQQRSRSLVDEATVQAFFERVRSNRRLGRRRHPGVERSLGALICQRVKKEFREEDQFTLNTNR